MSCDYESVCPRLSQEKENWGECGSACESVVRWRLSYEFVCEHEEIEFQISIERAKRKVLGFSSGLCGCDEVVVLCVLRAVRMCAERWDGEFGSDFVF